jgi:hypothetical protein
MKILRTFYKKIIFERIRADFSPVDPTVTTSRPSISQMPGTDGLGGN